MRNDGSAEAEGEAGESWGSYERDINTATGEAERAAQLHGSLLGLGRRARSRRARSAGMARPLREETPIEDEQPWGSSALPLVRTRA